MKNFNKVAKTLSLGVAFVTFSAQGSPLVRIQVAGATLLGSGSLTVGSGLLAAQMSLGRVSSGGCAGLDQFVAITGAGIGSVTTGIAMLAVGIGSAMTTVNSKNANPLRTVAAQTASAVARAGRAATAAGVGITAIGLPFELLPTTILGSGVAATGAAHWAAGNLLAERFAQKTPKLTQNDVKRKPKKPSSGGNNNNAF